MKTAPAQIAFLSCAILVILPLSGCTVGSKSFSMDSISRTPFFGLELRERKPRSTAPSYNSISQAAANDSRIEPALAVGFSKPMDLTSKPVDLTKAGDKRLANARVSGIVKNEIPGSELTSIPIAKGVGPQSIPLPRTDDRPGPVDRRASSTVVDFQ